MAFYVNLGGTRRRLVKTFRNLW